MHKHKGNAVGTGEISPIITTSRIIGAWITAIYLYLQKEHILYTYFTFSTMFIFHSVLSQNLQKQEFFNIKTSEILFFSLWTNLSNFPHQDFLSTSPCTYYLPTIKIVILYLRGSGYGCLCIDCGWLWHWSLLSLCFFLYWFLLNHLGLQGFLSTRGNKWLLCPSIQTCALSIFRQETTIHLFLNSDGRKFYPE